MILGKVAGLSQPLAELIAQGNFQVWQVRPAKSLRALGSRVVEADLFSPDGVQALVAHLRQDTDLPVGSIVNLIPLMKDKATRNVCSTDRSLHLAQGLLLVLKGFASDLAASALACGGRVLNVTGMGGYLGLDGHPSTDVAAAGTIGVAKSFRCEYPDIDVRIVDVDPRLPAKQLLPRLFAELRADDEHLEVGIDGEGRRGVRLRASVPNWNDMGPPPWNRHAVLLLTGGASGITFEIARRIAAFGATMVLVGRTPLAQEASETRAFDASQLRAHWIAKSSGRRLAVVPREIEQEVQRTLKQRRLRANLKLLRAAGAQIEYREVDVRDASAFGDLIDELHAQYGRLDGVIHAAGVIEDQLSAEKSLESFSSVMETKVRGAQVLSEKLDPKSCRFLAFFSSVSGRFGNVGQTDYAAANEVLNKLAGRLDAEWPGRVVAINWGPWDAGMVSDTLRQLYARRGIQLLSAEEGWRYFEAELRGWNGHHPTSEVVVAAGVQAIATAHRGRRHA